jgi:phenylpropionate dioxygenase-like ring-hydroxylating dioxygenase large terminal subunit
VLVVRGDDGELRAFQNACRHRGSAICEGVASGLTELQCPYHRWTWDLAGRLREVPSRKQFGVQNDDLPLVPVRVGVWGPLVFVNLAPDGESLEEFLDGVPADAAWARLEELRCVAAITLPAACNWKTLIEGFSETYHVQGIHREMLPMCDDVRGPQRLWKRHGKLQQSYGLPSPRLRDRPDDQQVWESFVEIMGVRVGNAEQRDAGPAPGEPAGSPLRTRIAELVRAEGRRHGNDYRDWDDGQVLDMSQYNLFPNVTVLVFADMVQVVRSRPGPTHLDAHMDVFALVRRPAADDDPRAQPFELALGPGDQLPLGLVLNQDVANFARAQRGLHQPGLTHLTVSAEEECRIVNLHRALDEFVGP